MTNLESLLERDFAGNPVSRWLIALAVVALTTVVLGVVKRLVALRLTKIAERTDTDLDDLLIDLVRRTARFFLFVLGVFFRHHWLVLSRTASPYVSRAVEIAIWVQIGRWGMGLVQFGIQRMTRGRAAD